MYRGVWDGNLHGYWGPWVEVVTGGLVVQISVQRGSFWLAFQIELAVTVPEEHLVIFV